METKTLDSLNGLEVLVILSQDGEDHEVSIIGVSDNVDRAKEMIRIHYGKHYKLLEEKDIRDDSIEFTQQVQWRWKDRFIIDTVTVHYMYLNHI